MAGRNRILIVLTVLLAVGFVGPIWWWALFGMSKDVGSAWLATESVLAIIVFPWWGAEVLS